MDKYNLITYSISENMKAKKLLEVGLISQEEYQQLIEEIKEYINEFISSI